MPNDSTGLSALRATRTFLLALLLSLLGLLPTLSVAQADEELSAEEEERLEAIDRHTERGWRAFNTGNHDEVLARMKRLRRYDEDLALPDFLTARVYERTGKYAEALVTAMAGVKRWPADLHMRALYLRLFFATGDLHGVKSAAQLFLEADANDLIARSAMARVYEEQGKRKEALAAYDKVLDGYNAMVDQKQERHPALIPLGAHAAERATWLSSNMADDMLGVAVRTLRRYSNANPQDLDALVQLAEVFRSDTSVDGQSKARKEYRLILKQNSELAAARVGQARTDLVFWNQPGALKQLERALLSNPNYVPALTVKAAIHVGNGDYKNAEAALAKALGVNPRDRECRSVKAALHHIRGEKEEYDALVKAILADDPTYGQVHVICAELVGERKRRYDLAAELARKAIEVDDRNRFAYTTLGEALMNLGQTDEALEVFNKGVIASKRYSDVRRDNWREVLTDVLPRYRVLESEHFRVRIPLGDYKVTGPYLMPLLEEAYETLCTKYGMKATVPTYVDAFDRPDDFSVRSVGSAGLPALGVCFGRVITILCPTARDVGSFSWSRTTWHEFAHVVTLQVSKGQVPRWLTEGLSVFEEKARRPRWGREMEQQLYNRWRNGRLLKMAQINSAFRGPDILFAYFQGGLICDHLQEDRGFHVIPEMLRKFGEDKSTKAVFKEVLGAELGNYDKDFHAFVGKIVGDYKMVPVWDDESMKAFTARVEKDAQDVEAWIRMAWGHHQQRRSVDSGSALNKALAIDKAHPEVILLQAAMAAAGGRADVAKTGYEKFLSGGNDDLRARLWLANHALTRGGSSDDVIKHLEAAKKCFPRYVAKDNPYVQLARLYRGGGDFERSIGELEAYAAIAAEDFGVRKELLRWYETQKNWAAVARVCEEMVDISPFGANVKKGQAPDLTVHRSFANALKELATDDAALLRELEVQVELGTLLDEDQQVLQGCVPDRLALGRKYLALNRPDDAHEQAVAALRLAPSDANALMLKQRAAEADERR